MCACLFQNSGCLLLIPPPPRRLGVGQEWVGGFEGKGYMRYFLYIFPCVGQSVSGWGPLELNHPPPPVGADSIAVRAGGP